MRRATNNLRKKVLVQQAQNVHNEAFLRYEAKLKEAQRYLFFQTEHDIKELENVEKETKAEEKNMDKILFKPWELK